MKSFLYIIYSEIGMMIGKSSDIYRRFAIIDSTSPLELQLFRVYRIQRNGIHVKRLHKRYAAKQIRGGWFALDFEDLGDIDRYLLENEGIRILDNQKKFKKSLEQRKEASIHHPGADLLDDIRKLEEAVEKLKGALAGRKKL